MNNSQFNLSRGIAILLIAMLNFSGAFGQNKIRNRKPVVAGQFYPGTEVELSTKLKQLYRRAEMDDNHNHIRALLVPHAGYDFSGEIAAYGYKQLSDLSVYDNIFILASSHRVSLGKASVYPGGSYITPLGEIKVNQEIAERLIENDIFCFEAKAHAEEHSIEVQLPFLQYLGKMPPIIPIVMASQVPSVAKEVAELLAPWFNDKNLFIISADFSHYPKYEDANHVDSLTAAAFCTGDPQHFLDVLESNERLKIRGLATSMCAWPAALTLLYLADTKSNLIYDEIKYANSGDQATYGDTRRVVGYHAISMREKNSEGKFFLSNVDKHDLLALSRATLQSYINGQNIPANQETSFSRRLNTKSGAFVSLKIDGRLRGCLGNFKPKMPLHKLIPELTISSASRDNRFLPVRSDELKHIEIEISVLTPMQKIDDISEIELGKHGIYIKQGNNSGTFLPQVAREMKWNLEEFLGHCAEDKAHIGYNGWKNADIYIYEAIVFKEL